MSPFKSLARTTSLIGLSACLFSSHLSALSILESESINREIVGAKTSVVPTVVCAIISKSAAAGRLETCKFAVESVAKYKPTTLSMVISAVLRENPEATESVVTAALSVAPEMTKTIVSAAMFATGEEQLIVKTAEKIVPSLVPAVRSSIVSAKSARALSADKRRPNAPVVVVNNPSANKPVVVKAYASRDPNRP